MTKHFYDPAYPECADEMNLCGGGDQCDYSWDKSEVTCERCLAALRSRESASAPGCLAAPSSAPAPDDPRWVPTTRAELDSYVRLAVVAERDRIRNLIDV